MSLRLFHATYACNRCVRPARDDALFSYINRRLERSICTSKSVTGRFGIHAIDFTRRLSMIPSDRTPLQMRRIFPEAIRLTTCEMPLYTSATGTQQHHQVGGLQILAFQSRWREVVKSITLGLLQTVYCSLSFNHIRTHQHYEYSVIYNSSDGGKFNLRTTEPLRVFKIFAATYSG